MFPLHQSNKEDSLQMGSFHCNMRNLSLFYINQRYLIIFSLFLFQIYHILSMLLLNSSYPLRFADSSLPNLVQTPLDVHILFPHRLHKDLRNPKTFLSHLLHILTNSLHFQIHRTLIDKTQCSPPLSNQSNFLIPNQTNCKVF